MTKYLSCNQIEDSILFNYNNISVCCISKQPQYSYIIEDIIKEDFSIEKLLKFRDEIRKQNKSRNIHPLCKDCNSLRLDDWSNREYILNSLIIANIYQCHLKCKYCYTVLFDYYKQYKEKQLYDVSKIVDNILENKYLNPNGSVFWSGGEPTLIDNFNKMFIQLNQYGCNQNLNTNGVMLASLDENIDKNKVLITCSLDAGTANTYTRIKGRNLFNRVLNNLRIYRNNEYSVSVKYIFQEDNYIENEIYSFLELMQKLQIKNVEYDIDFRVYEQPDYIINSIAKMIITSKEVGINIKEMPHGICQINPNFKNRLNKELERLK